MIKIKNLRDKKRTSVADDDVLEEISVRHFSNNKKMKYGQLFLELLIKKTTAKQREREIGCKFQRCTSLNQIIVINNQDWRRRRTAATTTPAPFLLVLAVVSSFTGFSFRFFFTLIYYCYFIVYLVALSPHRLPCIPCAEEAQWPIIIKLHFHALELLFLPPLNQS